MTINRRTFVAAGLSSILTPALAETPISIRDDLMLAFNPVAGNGAFALQTNSGLTLVNSPRARQRFVPASTFKIPNALIALETGALKDATEIIPYGVQPQPFKTWEKDMALAEAMAASNVPVFQELARRIGLASYAQWLPKLSYGNALTGTAVDRFWLDGPLAISAVEQIAFLELLAGRNLPISDRTHAIVRDCLKHETKGNRTIYAKTGWAMSTTPRIGWWVGWIEDRGRLTATFALNMDMAKQEDARKRLEIGKALLIELGVW
jgi:beta-lactamase class D